MKAGISIKIDVTKIDKSKIFVTQDGKKYVDLTVFVDDSKEDRFGYHGMVTQSVTKEEKAQGIQAPILGNGKVFWKQEEQQQQAWDQTRQAPQQPAPQPQQNFNKPPSDDLPF